MEGHCALVSLTQILAVKKFIDEGGEEVYYLGDRMADIMATFMFQSSRRQLLLDLSSQHEAAHKSQEELAAHQHEEDDVKQQEHDRAARRAENLLKGVHAADEQVKKLEYWSDIRDLSDATAAVDDEEAHNEPSFKNKQKARDGVPGLNQRPEPTADEVGKGKQVGDKSAPEAQSKKSQPSTTEGMLQSEEFWNDLKGFLQQRLQDQGEGERLAGVFREAWQKR